MLYMVYERFKADFLEAQEVYKQILDKKDELFNMTQPKSTRYDKERVSGGENVNSFEKYMILKERTNIDQNLEEAKTLVEQRKFLLTQKEQELRESKEIFNKIYVLKYLDGMKVTQISRKIHYSEAQIYRILNSIKNSINERK